MTVAKKRGFTIVELLVVITIIGFLMALLFPAINAVRVIARRGQCLSRQRQLGQGILNYTTGKDEFPAWKAARPLRRNEQAMDPLPQTDPWCWVPFILPHTDSSSVYDYLVSNGWDGYDDDVGPGSVPYVRRINTLICPADPPPSVNAAALSYVVNAGVPDASNSSDPMHFDADFNGVFFKHYPNAQKSRWVKQSLTYITDHDGASYTIMLSENVNAFLWGWGNTSSGSSLEAQHCILWGVSGQLQLNGPVESFAIQGHSTADRARPSSRHPGGFVVTFCSGSTDFLKQSIGLNVYKQLMTPNGFEIGQDPMGDGALD